MALLWSASNACRRWSPLTHAVYGTATSRPCALPSTIDRIRTKFSSDRKKEARSRDVIFESTKRFPRGRRCCFVSPTDASTPTGAPMFEPPPQASPFDRSMPQGGYSRAHPPHAPRCSRVGKRPRQHGSSFFHPRGGKNLGDPSEIPMDSSRSLSNDRYSFLGLPDAILTLSFFFWVRTPSFFTGVRPSDRKATDLSIEKDVVSGSKGRRIEKTNRPDAVEEPDPPRHTTPFDPE